MSKQGGFHEGPPPCPPPSYSQVMMPQPTVPLGAPITAGGPPIVTAVIPVGPNSTRMVCPSCHTEITSSVERKPGMIAYVAGFIIALLGCWCGCCFIPCCIDDCMDVHHNCPHCNAYLGRFRR